MMMNERDSNSSKKGELFIVDNSDIAWKVQKYLSEWCELSKKFDIATGYFEIGSLDFRKKRPRGSINIVLQNV